MREKSQRDFAPKNAVHFVSKLIIFQKVESDTSKNLGQLRTEVELNVTIVESFFDFKTFGKKS